MLDKGFPLVSMKMVVLKYESLCGSYYHYEHRMAKVEQWYEGLPFYKMLPAVQIEVKLGRESGRHKSGCNCLRQWLRFQERHCYSENWHCS